MLEEKRYRVILMGEKKNTVIFKNASLTNIEAKLRMKKVNINFYVGKKIGPILELHPIKHQGNQFNGTPYITGRKKLIKLTWFQIFFKTKSYLLFNEINIFNKEFDRLNTKNLLPMKIY